MSLVCGFIGNDFHHEPLSDAPYLWTEYAKFNLRAGPNLCGSMKWSGEFALKIALKKVEKQLAGSGMDPDSSLYEYREAKFAYIGLLIERRRYREAKGLLTSMIEKRRHDSMANLLMGIVLYLENYFNL